MQIRIIAVGKLKEKFWTEACAEYLKRIMPYAKIEVREIQDVDPAKAGGTSGALAREGTGILAAIPDRSHVILMAIRGQEMSSEALSGYLDDLGVRGTGSITFIIGGSDGVSKEVADRADKKISFGPITMPHNLARVVLLEQIYRAFKISRGEPYHK